MSAHTIKLLSRAEAAEALGLSERSTRRLTDEGSLSCVRIGRRVLYHPDAIRAFVNKRKLATPGQS